MARILNIVELPKRLRKMQAVVDPPAFPESGQGTYMGVQQNDMLTE